MSETLHLVCPHCEKINRISATRLGESPKCGHCHQSIFTGHPLELTTASFRRQIEHSDIPLVVDFWAPWCGPCRGFAPTFEKAAGDNPDIVFGKINTDEEQQLAAAFEIQSIPTLMLFRDRVLLFRQEGALPPAALADIVAQAKALDMERVRAEIAAHEAAEKAAKTPRA